MQYVRPFGTLSRVLRRFGSVGLCSGILGAALWYGCAGTNTDYAGNIFDGGNGDGGPSGPPDLTCVKSPDEDIPDDQGLDTNCDGIDGDINLAIFVSPAGDDMNLGTMESPVLTIGKGLSLAQQQQKHGVYLSAGTYNESVTLISGISIYGGYDANNHWIRTKASIATISGGPTAVTASNITKETHVDWVTIHSASGNPGSTGSPAGGSSYGVFVTNSTGPVHFRSDTIVAGSGGAGAAGANGVVPVTGTNNGNGGNGVVGQSNSASGGTGGTAGASACGRPGGVGGSGSQGQNGGPGTDGASNPSSGGGGGSKSGFCGTNGNTGGTGRSGTAGGNGLIGPQAAPYGSATAGGFQPASGGNGVSGSNAAAGGGGGAGGGGIMTLFACNPDTGGGGGGGGAGGCGGNAGVGGGGGGASIGVYAYMSTVVVFNTGITTGKGGDGGQGGNGSAGSVGGAGGQPGGGADDAAGGGAGGSGGKGGDAGAGSGGTGGPSFGIWTVKIDLDQSSTGNHFDGTGGSGGRGNGGTSPGTLGQGFPGSAGLSATTKFDP